MAKGLLFGSAQPLHSLMCLPACHGQLTPQRDQILLGLDRHALRLRRRCCLSLRRRALDPGTAPLDGSKCLQPGPVPSELHRYLQLGVPVLPSLLQFPPALLRLVVHGQQRCSESLLLLDLPVAPARRCVGFPEVLLPLCLPSALRLRLRGEGSSLLLHQRVPRRLRGRLCGRLGLGQLPGLSRGCSQARCSCLQLDGVLCGFLSGPFDGGF
mmetsp:Transcript_19550/g.43466  ORF Transcript_19550/g.43466 Transcript_19550/m.43466 type:complete len:212 (+) Transcript_19550:725-1360(+)